MEESVGLISSKWQVVKKESDYRPYHRIDKPISRRRFFTRRKSAKRPKVQRLGSKSKRRWGLRMPKIRIRVISPLTFLAKLRDAYVNFMMNLAGRSTLGMNLGPMGGSHALTIPSQSRTLAGLSLGTLTEAELSYLEYLKRDPTFMRPILQSHFAQ